MGDWHLSLTGCSESAVSAGGEGHACPRSGGGRVPAAELAGALLRAVLGVRVPGRGTHSCCR